MAAMYTKKEKSTTFVILHEFVQKENHPNIMEDFPPGGA